MSTTISTEGKIGLALGLVGLLGGGAVMVFPAATWIGGSMMAVALGGGALLAWHHFDNFPKGRLRITFAMTAIAFVGVTIWLCRTPPNWSAHAQKSLPQAQKNLQARLRTH